jgi:hypothetical protein
LFQEDFKNSSCAFQIAFIPSINETLKASFSGGGYQSITYSPSSGSVSASNGGNATLSVTIKRPSNTSNCSGALSISIS